MNHKLWFISQISLWYDNLAFGEKLWKVGDQDELRELRNKILSLNNKFAEGDYACNSTDFDFLVIVQVHKRLDFLKLLLESLIGAKGNYFVVVSADTYDESLIALVQDTLSDVCHR